MGGNHGSEPRRLSGVDFVAAILACGLVLGVAVIGAGVIINVVDHQTPTQVLGENATQVIIAVIGGLVGVLGSYVGAKVGSAPPGKHRADDE